MIFSIPQRATMLLVPLITLAWSEIWGIEHSRAVTGLLLDVVGVCVIGFPFLRRLIVAERLAEEVDSLDSELNVLLDSEGSSEQPPVFETGHLVTAATFNTMYRLIWLTVKRLAAEKKSRIGEPELAEFVAIGTVFAVAGFVLQATQFA